MKVVLLAWHPASIAARTTLGFADVRLPDIGIELNSVCVKHSPKGCYVTMPSAPIVCDGRQVTRQDGGYDHATLARFVHAGDFNTFSSAVIAVVRAKHPEAFADRRAA